ncbi:MAG: MBL fold metallo-hydrolase [Anaerolineae bacterium]|nr:MBL fold metallo-hydrolase [Anaerolineae bacterium]
MSQVGYEAVIPGVLLAPYPPDSPRVVSTILAKGSRLALIDSAFAEQLPATLAPALQALGAEMKDIDLVINTHGHGDHIGGNALVRETSGAQVWAAAGDAAQLPTSPDRRLAEGDTVDLGGGLAFQVVALPGHSAGHIGLYEPTRRLLIAADALQGKGSGVLPLIFYSGRAYRQTLQKVMGMDIAVLTTGHRYVWSGEPRLIHRGGDIARFLQDSLAALDEAEMAVQVALNGCDERTWPCLEQAFTAQLGQDPNQPLPPLFAATLRALLRDQGIDLPA